MKQTREKIPEKKTKALAELVRLLKESRSVTLVSIKNLPSSQFQAIKKSLRGSAAIRVAKKNIILKAIEATDKGVIKNFKKYIKEDTALMFSELDPFELSAILSRNKSMARAKVGQIVDEDIAVEPGPTELVPGPVISELSGLGIKFAIEDGKISIKEKKIIVKKGEAVNSAQAGIMAKFDMKPVAVGLEPLIAYDEKEDAIFEGIKIDQAKTIDELKNARGRALAFAVKMVYACKDTIGFLLAKARSQEQALDKLIKTDIQGGQ